MCIVHQHLAAVDTEHIHTARSIFCIVGESKQRILNLLGSAANSMCCKHSTHHIVDIKYGPSFHCDGDIIDFLNTPVLVYTLSQYNILVIGITSHAAPLTVLFD